LAFQPAFSRAESMSSFRVFTSVVIYFPFNNLPFLKGFLYGHLIPWVLTYRISILSHVIGFMEPLYINHAPDSYFPVLSNNP
jgi:hypothetical protein